jgi:Rhs element Vgr protein
MADSPNTGADGPVSLSILSNGSEIDTSIPVLSVLVTKKINRIASARLVLLDGDMPEQDFPLSNADTFKPGAEIEIKAGYWGGATETLFKGVVVRHGIKIDGNNFSRLVVECRDKAVAMTVGRKNANYVDLKDCDIIQQIIGNYGGLSSDVGATSTQHGELVQYYCTDWDFLLSRAEANGLLVLVDDGKVTVRAPQGDAPASLQVTYGVDLIELDTEIDARTQLSQVKAASWDDETQALVEEAASASSLTGQGNLASSDLSGVVNLTSFRLQTNAKLASDFLRGWAKARQLKAELARIRGRMRFQGNAQAKIGGVIALAGVGDRFNGNVYVTAVRHEIAKGNWVSEVEIGLSEDWFAERRDLVAPPASALVPGVEGLQIGVVTKLDEDPDADYRVQVRVPLLQAENEGVWARLGNFYASSGIGAFFVPEIDDEVVLGYLNNDPAHPVILGSLYSKQRKAPYELAAENNTKALVTRSELKLELDEEKKVITILTPAGNEIVLSDDGKSILVQDQTNNKVELTETGITLDSPKDIQIKATGKISLTANGAIDIKSSADVSVQGLNVSNQANVGFSAQGSASAEVSSGGQTTVKGAMVMIN